MTVSGKLPNIYFLLILLGTFTQSGSFTRHILCTFQIYICKYMNTKSNMANEKSITISMFQILQGTAQKRAVSIIFGIFLALHLHVFI